MQYSTLFLSTLLLCMVGSIWADVPTDGSYYHINNALTNKYLEAGADGSVYLVDTATQAWLVQYSSTTGKYSFKNMDVGLSLDVDGSSIRALTTTNTDSQQFTLVDTEAYDYDPLPYLIQFGNYYINGDGSVFMESIYSTGGPVLMWGFTLVTL